MTRLLVALIAVIAVQVPDPFAVKPGTRPDGFRGPIVSAETKHLALTATLKDDGVAPGERLTIAYDITPHRGIHVYAPGKHDYQIISVAIDPQPWLKAQPVSYPASEIYDFKPLNERVEVFSRQFRLTQDVAILATPQAQKALANQKSISISGRVNYQACDDVVCYAPVSVPVQWVVALK